MNSQITEEEIGAIYDRHFDKIYRFFYYKTLSREHAEDLVAETFTTFVKEIRRREVENADRYLYGIAQFTFSAWLRSKYRQIRQVPLEVADFIQHMESTLHDFDFAQSQLEELAKKYIDLLPEKQKRVLHMRLIERLTIAEIAKQLGKNINYVKTTQKRAAKAIRKYLALYPPRTLGK